MDDAVLEHLYQIMYGDLHLCGCGNPVAAWQLTADLLRLMPLYDDDHWERAVELIGTPGAVHIVLSTLEEAGLIEHGSSIRGSWIIDKGEWLLWALGQFEDLSTAEKRTTQVGFPHDGEDACNEACWAVTG